MRHPRPPRAPGPARSSTAALVGAALLGGVLAGSLLTGGVPAAAASARDGALLGTVSLTPSGGGVSDNPMLVSATTSAACPTGYGTDVLLRVGAVGGPYNNIVRPASAGGYDRGPVTLPADRSMATALGRVPADGEYRVVVECSGVGVGRHPGRFETSIVVRGGAWRAGDGAEGGAARWWAVGAGLLVVAAAAVTLLVRVRRPERVATRTRARAS